MIIPALNAAVTLPACLESLNGGADIIREIIVVDGGSTDTTSSLAAAAGALVRTTPAGRGGQLRAGAAAARGEFLLLLHADTNLAPGWPQALSAAFKHPNAAGYFRLRLNSPARAARLLESIAALRCLLFALPYGDQGLLISRTLLTAIGGIPDLPLMEDVALARRLGRQRLRRLPATAITSAARYEQEGWARRPLRNLCCLTLYFLGVPPARIRRLYG